MLLAPAQALRSNRHFITATHQNVQQLMRPQQQLSSRHYALMVSIHVNLYFSHLVISSAVLPSSAMSHASTSATSMSAAMGKVQFGYGEVVGTAVVLVGAIIGGALVF